MFCSHTPQNFTAVIIVNSLILEYKLPAHDTANFKENHNALARAPYPMRIFWTEIFVTSSTVILLLSKKL